MDMLDDLVNVYVVHYVWAFVQYGQLQNGINFVSNCNIVIRGFLCILAICKKETSHS